MRLVIEADDFRRLSKATQRELIRFFAGRGFADRHYGEPQPPSRRSEVEWRRPIDLTPELTMQLMHGLGENHRQRLSLFARTGGRVSMKQLLHKTGDTDPKVLSYFQSVVTRKLRRILGDHEKQALLIGWDYDATRWNREHTQIVDGVYFVTEPTASALQGYFDRAR